jgi:hypothetical protein
MRYRHHLGETYNPSFFLAALGNGGLAISFFVYLTFMVPHKGAPIVTFEHIYAQLQISTLAIQALIVLALMAVVFFAVQHFRTLIWNIVEYREFRTTPAYDNLLKGPGEVMLMAMPLTYAMTINVSFALGALFVPGLWSIVEYMFPAALLAFAGVAVYALMLFRRFFTRVAVSGGLGSSETAHFGMLVPSFAFAMIGVGFAAPAAMSTIKVVAAIAMIFAIFFITVSLFLAAAKLILGLRGIFEHGLSRAAAGSIWILIPILTVTGIGLIRLQHGLAHHFGAPSVPADYLILITVFLSVQLLIGFLGHAALERLGYFDDFIHGNEKNPATYALICPGVGLVVFGMFFLSAGLVATDLVVKFSVIYFILLTPILLLQAITIRTLFRLNGKLLAVSTSNDSGENGVSYS